jgi:hypothetical protein
MPSSLRHLPQWKEMTSDRIEWMRCGFGALRAYGGGGGCCFAAGRAIIPAAGSVLGADYTLVIRQSSAVQDHQCAETM